MSNRETPPTEEGARAEAAEKDEQAGEAAADKDATALAAEVAELRGELLRALAETENTRRRAAREREDTQRYAIAGFARDLLPVVDNLRRALENVPEDLREDPRVAAVLEGIEMTERELLGVLERHGVRKVDPRGEPFDHNLHQAMFEIETTDVPPGTVVEVMQPGYVLADRLLRPAMVGVAKAPREAPEHVDTEA